MGGFKKLWHYMQGRCHKHKTNFNSTTEHKALRPQFFKPVVIARLFSKWFGLGEKVAQNDKNNNNSLVETYLDDFDNRFKFMVENNLVSQESYNLTKSYYVFKCLAIHYNLSVPV